MPKPDKDAADASHAQGDSPTLPSQGFVVATGHNDPVAAAKDRLGVTPIGMEPECGALIGQR
jgi:hypothetical protein